LVFSAGPDVWLPPVNPKSLLEIIDIVDSVVPSRDIWRTRRAAGCLPPRCASEVRMF
jgi:hypothetical protein